MKDGKVLHRKGYGLANIQKKIPVSPESVFDLGSIGKQFTAMAIMILAERGHLSYDDKLTSFFPEFPSYADELTINIFYITPLVYLSTKNFIFRIE
jgi:CubicO group peptidase (beta-lactamase class C family)